MFVVSPVSCLHLLSKPANSVILDWNAPESTVQCSFFDALPILLIKKFFSYFRNNFLLCFSFRFVVFSHPFIKYVHRSLTGRVALETRKKWMCARFYKKSRLIYTFRLFPHVCLLRCKFWCWFALFLSSSLLLFFLPFLYCFPLKSLEIPFFSALSHIPLPLTPYSLHYCVAVNSICIEHARTNCPRGPEDLPRPHSCRQPVHWSVGPLLLSPPALLPKGLITLRNLWLVNHPLLLATHFCYLLAYFLRFLALDITSLNIFSHFSGNTLIL